MKIKRLFLKESIHYFFCLLVLLIVPNFFFFVFLHEKRVTTVFLNNITLVVLIILLMKFSVMRFFGFLILTLFILNNGLDVLSLVFYKEPFNVSMALSFLSTNSRESIEMASEYWFVFIIAILYGVLLLYPIRFFKNYLSTRFLFILLAILLIKPVYSFCEFYVSERKDVNFTLYKGIGEKNARNYFRFIPVSTLSPFAEAWHYLSIVERTTAQKYHYPPFHIEKNNIQNIIVILGESASRESLSLYGNKVNTTPLIEKRISNLLIFDSAIAPAAITNLALSLMLSKQLPSRNFSVQENQDNIISLANETKLWYTYWISNQEKLGLFVNLFANIDLKAKHRTWVENDSFDEAILPLLDPILNDTATNRLIFVHLQGSHPDAGKRYPRSFNKFKVNNQNFINEYYNSIAYTDFIIDQIINKVEETNSIVIYVSDHGQSIVNGAYRHSFTKKGVEVPFFIWHSNSVDDSLKRSGRVDSFISTTNLYNILSDLMGIQGLASKPKNELLKVMDGTMEPTTYSQLKSDE